jgi:hypothetical protein
LSRVYPTHTRENSVAHVWWKCISLIILKIGQGPLMHNECIETQYCHRVLKDMYRCEDRKCEGLCLKNAHCLTNKCDLIQCKPPEKGCKKNKYEYKQQ